MVMVRGGGGGQKEFGLGGQKYCWQWQSLWWLLKDWVKSWLAEIQVDYIWRRLPSNHYVGEHDEGTANDNGGGGDNVVHTSPESVQWPVLPWQSYSGSFIRARDDWSPRLNSICFPSPRRCLCLWLFICLCICLCLGICLRIWHWVHSFWLKMTDSDHLSLDGPRVNWQM